MSGTEIFIAILGGVGLLLWGCRMIRTGVMRAFGEPLMGLVGRWAGNRFTAAAAGAAVGTLLQSSTATALLVSPFVAQGAVATSIALAVMLGADLGSAVAALVFSSGVSVAWPAFAFIGYVLHAAFGERNIIGKHIGRILIGLGLLFLGLRTIGAAAASLSSSHVIHDVVEASAREPLLAVVVGALLTWMSYSSIAVVLFAVALAAGAGIAADHLFPLILGVNLGAALPALSSTFSEPPAMQRVPLGNLLFRAGGVALGFAVLPHAGRLAIALADNSGAGIIAFHLIFNAALIPIFIGFVGPVGALLRRWLPDASSQEARPGPRYLDQSLLRTPSAAIGAAGRETLRMGEIIEDMLAKTMQVFDSADPALVRAVEAGEEELDAINDAIKLYMTRLMQNELGDDDIQKAIDIITYTTNLEHVGDIIDRNLIELAGKKARLKLAFSDEGRSEIADMHARVMDTLNLSLNVFMSGQVDGARELLLRKSELRTLELEGTERHLGRLRSGVFESMLTSSIHLDVIRDFKRINSHLVSVAYPVLERAGELERHRAAEAVNRGYTARPTEP